LTVGRTKPSGYKSRPDAIETFIEIDTVYEELTKHHPESDPTAKERPAS